MTNTSYRQCANPSCRNLTRKKYRFCQVCRKAKITPSNPTDTTETFPETIEERGNERTIEKVVSGEITSLKDLIEKFKIDTTEWEIIYWRANVWQMGFKDASQQAHKLPLYQVRATMKKKVSIVAAKNEIEALKELAKQELTLIGWGITARDVPHYHKPTGNMLELDIFDLHLGKLAWSKETGYQNYDLKIAKALFTEALEVLIRRTSHFTFDQVILPIGNDFFHTDNLITETSHGTRQDCDGRFHKSAYTGRVLLVEAIERLRTIAPVRVIVTPGNHDQLSAWHLGDSLECYFHRDSDVTIDNMPTLRKFHEFGKVGLMFTHGNRGKELDYGNIFATEQPDMWGRTRYREAHIGHWHKTKIVEKPTLNEHHGFRVRTISSLCSADAWHSEMMLTSNRRSAEAFVWNSEEGEISHATFSVKE